MKPDGGVIRHASSVAVDGKGLLICGVSGSGKSSLALDLISRGAVLVADDRTELRRQGDAIVMTCPPAIRGRIEARGLGILAAPFVENAPLRAVVDLDQTEPDRLPPFRTYAVLGRELPLLQKSVSPYFAAAILHYLKHGRQE